MPETPNDKSNIGQFLEKRFELTSEALIQRQVYEQNLQRWEAQRHADDRNDQNNDPFPNASNIRYALSDMIIEQKKAVYSQIIYSSEELAVFKALTPRNAPWCGNVAPYFSQIIKERTEWEEENVYALDAGLQDGESWMKISYDMDLEVPVFKWDENLMMIYPGSATRPKNFPWLTEVIHLTEEEAFAKFGKLPDFDKLWAMASDDNGNSEQSDLVGRMRQRYLRRGINVSNGMKRLVIWNHHYEDKDGNKRIVAISPDDPKFDLGGNGTVPNDREYPFWSETNGKRKSDWMFEQFRRELTTPNQHSSRGIPEIVEEYEFLLTALWRFKHNVMTMTQNPSFTTPNGLPPGSTNNYTMVLGGFLPSGAQPVQWPAPPISFDEEMGKTREIAERRMGSFDSGLSGDAGQQDSRTAREIGLVESVKQMAVNYESTTWKKFCRSCYRQAWERIVQFKPKSLGFFLKGTLQSLPPEAINGDYQIDLSWSGDNINKEFLGQKAQALHNAALQLGNQRVISETWKNLIENFAPGQTQRFELNPQIEQQDMGERIANELDTIVSGNYPVRVKEDIDHYTAVLMTFQKLQANGTKVQMLQQAGKDPSSEQFDQQEVTLLSQYMQGHREMLKTSNPQQYNQLNAQLKEYEMAHQQQQAQQMAPNVTQMPQQGMPEQPQIPQNAVNMGIPQPPQ